MYEYCLTAEFSWGPFFRGQKKVDPTFYGDSNNFWGLIYWMDNYFGVKIFGGQYFGGPNLWGVKKKFWEFFLSPNFCWFKNIFWVGSTFLGVKCFGGFKTNV